MSNGLTFMPLPKRKPVEEDTYVSPDDELAKKLREQKRLAEQDKNLMRLKKEHPKIADLPPPTKPAETSVDFGDEGATIEAEAPAASPSPKGKGDSAPNPADYEVVVHPSEGAVIRHKGDGSLLSGRVARSTPGFEDLIKKVMIHQGGGGVKKAMESGK
jgi:hypothetical protein